MLRGFCSANISANVEHANTTSNGTVHQKLTTAELVDENEEPDECDDCLDNAEDASSEE